MLIIYFIGLFSWEVYGLIISNIPLIAANAVSILLVIPLIWLKSKYG